MRGLVFSCTPRQPIVAPCDLMPVLSSGMQLLNQIFKRWQNRELFGCWQGMNNNFKDDYADWKMQQQLAAMNGKLQAEALRK